MVALLVNVQYSVVIGLHVWFKVEGYVKKVHNLFVSVDCDLTAI